LKLLVLMRKLPMLVHEKVWLFKVLNFAIFNSGVKA